MKTQTKIVTLLVASQKASANMFGLSFFETTKPEVQEKPWENLTSICDDADGYGFYYCGSFDYSGNLIWKQTGTKSPTQYLAELSPQFYMYQNYISINFTSTADSGRSLFANENSDGYYNYFLEYYTEGYGTLEYGNFYAYYWVNEYKSYEHSNPQFNWGWYDLYVGFYDYTWDYYGGYESYKTITSTDEYTISESYSFMMDIEGPQYWAFFDFDYSNTISTGSIYSNDLTYSSDQWISFDVSYYDGYGYDYDKQISAYFWISYPAEDISEKVSYWLYDATSVTAVLDNLGSYPTGYGDVTYYGPYSYTNTFYYTSSYVTNYYYNVSQTYETSPDQLFYTNYYYQIYQSQDNWSVYMYSAQSNYYTAMSLQTYYAQYNFYMENTVDYEILTGSFYGFDYYNVSVNTCWKVSAHAGEDSPYAPNQYYFYTCEFHQYNSYYY